MNFNTHALRSASDDNLTINEVARHQYRRPMQAGVFDEDMLDVALNRRPAQAMMSRRNHRCIGVWLAEMSVCALAGLLWALN